MTTILSYQFDHDFLSLIQQLETDIYNGHGPSALARIESLQVNDTRAKRCLGHLQAKYYLVKGDFAKSIDIIQTTMDNYGPHIGLLADQACAFYMKGDFIKWKLYVEEIKKQTQAAEPLLNKESYHKTLILLGKFSEELGQVSEALNCYHRVLKNMDVLRDDYPMLLAQITRIQAQWGILDKSDEYYTELFSINKKIYHQNFQIEIVHALILAEAELFGLDYAQKLYLENVSHINQEDRNLIIFDLLEICLRKNLEFPQKLGNLIELESTSEYEKSLYRLYLGKELSLQQISRDQSPASILVLLSLSINKNKNEELYKRYLLLTNSLDSKSKKMWLGRVKENFFKQKRLYLSLEKSELLYNGQVIKLARKKNILSLLHFLGRQKRAPIEDVVQSVWKSEFNESYFHRLRMAVKRFNQEILLKCYLEELIKVSSDSVELNNLYQLEIK